MICPKCKSKNIRIQTEEVNDHIIPGFSIFFLILGLLKFGYPDGLYLTNLGLVIGIIVQLLAPTKFKYHGVCQDCGPAFDIDPKSS